EDDHSGNSIDDINKPRRGFKWWILVIIYVFFFSGTVLCVNLLMRDNTDIGAFLYVYYMILIWTSKKLKKFFRNKVHLAELMEGLMRSFYQDTCCFTITKMISQITITFQKEKW
uniref:Uncharacterized protein n=1 Tax=Amphimedon queenslandica TaxID=400682 RepID=A0A1X7U048_AMPQE